MPAKRIDPALVHEAHEAVRQHGSQNRAARELGIPRNTLQSRLRMKDTMPAKPDVLTELRKGPTDIHALAFRCQLTQGQVLDILLAAKDRGMTVHQAGSIWSFTKEPQAGTVDGLPPYLTKKDGTFICGAMGDTHLGSKYCRLDVLHDLYRRFKEAGVDRVFHTGNWIDGEDERKNRYDLHVHGMDGQIDYLAQEYPLIPGVKTYAVAGNDHEGWYGQRNGIDIGRHAELLLHKAGRTDWVHLGHMEAFLPIQHPKTGASSMLHVMHPGGGSSYAVSYTAQKIAEGYEGGEKPAMTFLGHYHKMGYLRTRNIRMLQTGCTQDLTPWARGKKLRYEIGGWIVRGRIDAETGAIVSCSFEDFGYFNKGYHQNNRWSHGGDVNLVDRATV